MICLLPVGLLADRFGGKVVNSLGLFLWSVATTLTGFAPNVPFMIGTRMVMGMGESASWPASNRIIREWFPASERGFANAIFGAGASFGPAAGALVISAIVAAFGWRTGFFVAGSIGLVWLAAWLIFFDKPERVNWLSQAERCLILTRRDGGAVRTGGDEHPPSSLWQLLRLRSVWGLFLTQGCEVYGGYMLLTWLPSYLQQAKGLSVMHAGMLTAIPFAMAALVGIGLGKLSDWFLTPEAVQAGRRRTMLAVMLTGKAAMLIVPWTNQLWLIIVVLAGVSAMPLASSALNFALVTDIVRSRADIGKVTSTTVIGGNSFGLMVPIIIGYIVAITGGFDKAFYIAGLLPLIGALATLTMTRRLIHPLGDVAPAPGWRRQ